MSDLPFKFLVCHCTKFPPLAAADREIGIDDDTDETAASASMESEADDDAIELEEDEDDEDVDEAAEVGADTAPARPRLP